MAFRLNGWHRLFVLVGLLYGSAVFVYVSRTSTDEIVARWTSELDAVGNEAAARLRRNVEEQLEREEDGTATEAFVPGVGIVPFAEAQRVTVYDAELDRSIPWDEATQLRAQRLAQMTPRERAVAREVEMNTRLIFLMKSDPVYQAEMQWANDEFDARVEAQWPRLWLIVILYWLPPMAVLYAAGWAAAWVRRGFREDVRTV